MPSLWPYKAFKSPLMVGHIRLLKVSSSLYMGLIMLVKASEGLGEHCL